MPVPRDTFDLEFLDELPRTDALRSVDSICGALAQLGQPADSAT